VLRSPTGDVDRPITLWCENGLLGVGFRAFHAHPSEAGIDAFVELILAIVDGHIVGVRDPLPKHAQLEPVVDLRDPKSLIEELTHPFSSGRAELVSWSGISDRRVTIEDSVS
jgi:hypothetical protein